MAQYWDSLTEEQNRILGPWLKYQGHDGEYKGYCIRHETPGRSKPSAGYNFELGTWNCMAGDCGAKGTIAGAMKLAASMIDSNEDEDGNVVAFRPRSELDKAKASSDAIKKDFPTNDKQVYEFCQMLCDPAASKIFASLTGAKGLTTETAAKWRLGVNPDKKHELVIPIYYGGELVDVKAYNPRNKQRKMRHVWTGTKVHIYGEDVLADNDTVVLCEGEPDTWVANQNGVPAVTSTGGAKTPIGPYRNMFRDKRVYVCYDADKDGAQQGPLRAEELYGIAAEVYVVNLRPHLPKDGKDVADFFNNGGTASEFKNVLQESDLYMPKTALKDPPAPTKADLVPLLETLNMEADSPRAVNAVVVGVPSSDQPWRVPKRINGACTQDKGDACNSCPMLVFNGDRTLELEPNNPSIAEFLEVGIINRVKLCLRLLGAKCSTNITVTEEESMHVEDLMIAPRIEDSDDINGFQRRALAVGAQRQNASDQINAIVQEIPDPKTQRSVLLAWGISQLDSSIDSFRMTDETAAELEVFVPRKGQSPLDKMLEIGREMGHSVTGITNRELLHVALDIAWHSVLTFDLGTIDTDVKGWVDAAIVGDTRTGKTQAAERLCRHYREGALWSCEGSSFAGLVGGAEKSNGGSWFIQWGVIPRYDRRLVILDEFSGMTAMTAEQGIIEKMSSVRSSGVASITKIAAANANARTRLLWISNPKPEFGMLGAQKGGGVRALKSLIKAPEDIARFDYFIAVAADEVDADTPDGRPAIYTSDACANLLRWAWSRTSGQIVISQEVSEHIGIVVKQLKRDYPPNPDVPLIQSENVRLKIARIACSIAARTFSCDMTLESLVVTTEHVDDAVRFLNLLYGNEFNGYRRQAEQRAEARREPDTGEVEEMVTKLNNATQNNPELLGLLMDTFEQGQYLTARLIEGARIGVSRVILRELHSNGIVTAPEGNGTNRFAMMTRVAYDAAKILEAKDG